MEKKLLLLSLPLLVLASCGPTGSESESTTSLETVDEGAAIQAVIDELAKEDNFTFTYYNGAAGTTPYNAYRGEAYFYDDYNGFGLLYTPDEAVYEYRVVDGVALVNTPFVGTKATAYDPNSEPISFDLEEVGQDLGDGLYQINADGKGVAAIEALAHAGNFSIYYNGQLNLVRATLFLDDDENLNVVTYDAADHVIFRGTFSDVGESVFQPASDFLALGIDPEDVKTESLTLSELFGEGDFPVLATCNVSGIGTYQMGLGKDYYYYPAAKEGAAILSDDYVRIFTYDGTNLNVEFDYAADRPFYEDYYGLGRVDYSRFMEVGNDTFYTTDYFNVGSFAHYLAVSDEYSEDSLSPDAMKIVVTGTDSADVSFYQGGSLVAMCTLTEIGTYSFEPIEDYMKSGILPTLPSNPNTEALVAAFEGLDSFEFTSDDQSAFTVGGQIVEGLGRLEKTADGFLAFAYGSNYLKLGERYYHFEETALGQFAIDLSVSMDEETYEREYSLASIDFSTFYYLGDSDGRYRSSNPNHLMVFANVFTLRASMNLVAVYITLNDDGSIYVEIEDSTWGNSGYTLRKSENTALQDLVTEYASYTLPPYENADYVAFFEELSKGNFTVTFLDTEADSFGDKNKEYYTPETYYSSYFDDGVMKTDSGYFYEYAGPGEDAKGVSHPWRMGSHPLDYDSIFEASHLDAFTRTALTSMPSDGVGIYSNDGTLIEAIGSMAYMDVSYVNRLRLSLDEAKETLTITLLTLEYDETHNESHYEVYVEMEISEVGTTVLPDGITFPPYRK